MKHYIAVLLVVVLIAVCCKIAAADSVVGGFPNITTFNLITNTQNNTLPSVSNGFTTEMWASSLAGPKTDNIPACVPAINSFFLIESDGQGTASQGNIDVHVPAGSIGPGVGSTDYFITTNLASAVFQCDGSSTNWRLVGLTAISSAVRSVTAATDTIGAFDNGNVVKYTSAAAVAVALPQLGTSGFGIGAFQVMLYNNGSSAGAVSVTPQGGSTINGATSLAVPIQTGVYIVAESAASATNYVAIPMGGGGAGGTVTLTGPITGSGTGTIATSITPGAVTTAALGAGAVTASALASGAVTASALAAGAVTNPALGSGAVTGAKVASATIADTNLTTTGVTAGSCTNCNLSYTAQGRVTAAANGTGGGGGGATTLISTQTASNSASLQFTGTAFSTSYQDLEVRCRGLLTSTSTVTLAVYYGEGSGPTWLTGANYWVTGWYFNSTDTSHTSPISYRSSTATDLSLGGIGADTTIPTVIKISIESPASTTIKKMAYMHVIQPNSPSASMYYIDSAGMWNGDSAALSGLQIAATGGTIVSGSCSLYGFAS